MTHPQTIAKEIYQAFRIPMFEPIADGACCILTLMWCLRMDKLTDYQAIQTVHEMIYANAIKGDCTVKWYDAVKWLTGRPLRRVDFKNIKSIKNIKERTPVLFRAENPDDPENPFFHWVGVEDGEIRFNSLAYSRTIETGKPVECRVLVL